MKKHIWMFGLICLLAPAVFAGCTASETRTESSGTAKGSYEQITPDQAKELMDNEVNYIFAHFIKNDENFTEEENEYVLKVANQDDVKEFHNRVTNEYNELMLGQPELLDYLGELGQQVDKAVGSELEAIGVAMAEQHVGEDDQPEGEGAPEASPAGDVVSPEPPVAVGPQYAVTTATVNVRGSDSEKADKIGKVASGARVQVQEVQINGWTRIVFEGQDGFIKSEYLSMEENTATSNVIGKVTATANINVRAAASSEAERLGLLSGGQTLELLSVEDGWCKVIYNGQIGYISAEYVTQE